MTSTATHALRDRWFVSFLPLLTADTVNTEFKGDWKLAAHQKMQRLDWVTTVEEVWSTMNSLPRIQQLGVGSTFIFSREDKEPSFETFPCGSRLVVKLHRAPATDKGLETIIAAVLGETVTEEATGGAAVCDVIRISARPSREHSDLVRVEVWLNDAAYSAKVAEFLKAAFRERGLAANQYAMEDGPFEAGSPASPKLHKTPPSTSSPLLVGEKAASKEAPKTRQEAQQQELEKSQKSVGGAAAESEAPEAEPEPAAKEDVAKAAEKEEEVKESAKHEETKSEAAAAATAEEEGA